MKKDPYRILQISPDADDSALKRAYRELARKYHPDHYHGTPLETMAEEKMKEINEAYSQICALRKNGWIETDEERERREYEERMRQEKERRDSRERERDALLRRAQDALQQGDVHGAERLLNECVLHSAQWHFLKGSVRYRQGWLDEAEREFEMASLMEPDNELYRDAYEYMRSGGSAYRPEGFESGGMMSSWCKTLLCASLVCGCCSNGRLLCRGV